MVAADGAGGKGVMGVVGNGAQGQGVEGGQLVGGHRGGQSGEGKGGGREAQTPLSLLAAGQQALLEEQLLLLLLKCWKGKRELLGLLLLRKGVKLVKVLCVVRS